MEGYTGYQRCQIKHSSHNHKAKDTQWKTSFKLWNIKINRSGLQLKAKGLIEKECLTELFCEKKSVLEMAGLAFASNYWLLDLPIAEMFGLWLKILK